jgi:hypothetical protein
MSNPHFEILVYAFESLDDRHDFTKAAAWNGDLGDFECRLDGAQLEARPRSHYPNIQKAREALKPHLIAWELRSELNDGIRMRFKPAQHAWSTQPQERLPWRRRPRQ